MVSARRGRRAASIAAHGALAALLATLTACSLGLDFDDECADDSACDPGLRCVQRLCVADATGGAADAGPGAWPPTLPPMCNGVYGVDAADAWGDNTVRLGLILPITGALGAVGPPMERAVFLAADEINQSGGVGGKRLALVACDSGTDPAQAVQAATWLIDAARVPAIIGPAASSATLQVLTEVALARETLLISPSATSPALTDQQDANLLWRTAPSDAIQGRAISAYLQAEGLSRVAVLNRNDTYGNGLTEAIRSSLCAARPCDDDTYFNRRYEEAAGAGDLASLFSQVQAFAPDALVLVAFVSDGVQLVNLAALAGITRLILTDGTKDRELLAQVNDPAALRAAVGTAPAAPAGDTYQAFARRYEAQWGSEPGVFNAQAYDALYLLGFAVGAQLDLGPLSGPALAGQLARLSAGEPVSAGPTDFNRGLGLLLAQAGASIDYVGASGALDFDAKGEAPADIEAWRFDLDSGDVVSLNTIFTSTGEYRAPVAADGPDQDPADGPDAGAPDAGAPEAAPDAAR